MVVNPSSNLGMPVETVANRRGRPRAAFDNGPLSRSKICLLHSCAIHLSEALCAAAFGQSFQVMGIMPT